MRKTQRINIESIVADIHSGMGDVPIMEKHGLSPRLYGKILDKLQNVGAITSVELLGETHRAGLSNGLRPVCPRKVESSWFEHSVSRKTGSAQTCHCEGTSPKQSPSADAGDCQWDGHPLIRVRGRLARHDRRDACPTLRSSQ